MRKKLLTILILFFAVAASGQCLNGDCNNGKGMYKYPNGSIYEGGFKNQLPHGQGRLAKTNGNVYEGSFEYGMFNGIGTLFTADSTVYTGSFHQGIKQGKGTITYANGKPKVLLGRI